MLSVTDLRPLDTATADLSRIIPRANVDVSSVVPVVAPIIEQVRHGGERTLLDLAERFDGVRPPALRVPGEALEAALAGLDPRVRAALEESIRRARLVHDAQHPQDSTVELGEGAVVENHWIPVGRVGLYVPGGRAVYPSSVVMNVVPAQAAGVGSLAVTSPPQRDHGGLPHPTVLAACALLGVDEVYAAGGAQAVAMLAHGVQDDDGGWLCAPVDLVTGPGNVYVAAAKRALQGVIGVDAEAGPSEIAVIADGTARADWVAADLISQSEHDPLAASVLITDSEDLLRDVLAAIEAQVPGRSTRIRSARPSPAPSPACCWCGTWTRPWRSPTATPPSTSRSRRATPRPSWGASATPAPCSWARTPPCRWATTRPGPTMCSPPRGRPGTPPV